MLANAIFTQAQQQNTIRSSSRNLPRRTTRLSRRRRRRCFFASTCRSKTKFGPRRGWHVKLRSVAAVALVKPLSETTRLRVIAVLIKPGIVDTLAPISVPFYFLPNGSSDAAPSIARTLVNPNISTAIVATDMPQVTIIRKSVHAT